jgi:hypothetical protein
MSNNNTDDNLAARAKKEGDEKKPHSKYKQLKAAYESVSVGFFRSAAGLELRQVLTPMIGRVDKIFIAGLGSPEELSEGTLRQVAMMAIAYDVLRGPKKQHKVEVLQTDPRTTELDEDFFFDCFGEDFTDIEHDEAAQKADERPKEYILHCQGKELSWKSWPEQSPVEKALRYVTSSTLLFMPYMPTSCALRYVAGTSPAMIIANGLSGMWNYTVLRQSKYRYADHESTELFRTQWKKENEAWEKLRTQYQRRPLVKHNAYVITQNGLGVYLPLPDGEKVGNGWVTGDTGLDLELGNAEYALLHC